MNTSIPFWQRPLGYLHSALLCVGLLWTGFAIEWFMNGKGIAPLAFPINAIILLLFALWLALLIIPFRNHRLILWIGSIPMSLCVFATLFLLGTIAGFFEQGHHIGSPWIQRLGLNHIVSSAPFAIIIALLLTNLGFSILQRMVTQPIRQWFFLINHVGIWLVFAGGFLGAGDIVRLKIFVQEGVASSIGLDEERRAYRLPFTILLRDFVMDEYPATLTLVDNSRQNITLKKGEANIELIAGNQGKIRGHHIQVLQAFQNAEKYSDSFIPSTNTLAPQATQIRVTQPDQQIIEGWISYGNSSTPPQTLLAKDFHLAMAPPKAKRFASDITLLRTGESPRLQTISVNQPISYHEWSLYQSSYDYKAGKSSSLSIIEAIRDPWLPIVYFGIGLMLIGTLAMLIRGSVLSSHPIL